MRAVVMGTSVDEHPYPTTLPHFDASGYFTPRSRFRVPRVCEAICTGRWWGIQIPHAPVHALCSATKCTERHGNSLTCGRAHVHACSCARALFAPLRQMARPCFLAGDVSFGENPGARGGGWEI